MFFLGYELYFFHTQFHLTINYKQNLISKIVAILSCFCLIKIRNNNNKSLKSIIDLDKILFDLSLDNFIDVSVGWRKCNEVSNSLQCWIYTESFWTLAVTSCRPLRFMLRMTGCRTKATLPRIFTRWVELETYHTIQY